MGVGSKNATQDEFFGLFFLNHFKRQKALGMVQAT
jgi:hypothetical protein